VQLRYAPMRKLRQKWFGLVRLCLGSLAVGLAEMVGLVAIRSESGAMEWNGKATKIKGEER